MRAPIFVTTSVYALAHELGQQEAVDEVKRQLDYPDGDALPVVRTISRLRQLVPEGVHLHVDAGATYIGMARSRAFHEAVKTGLAWLTLDDDIETTSATLVGLLDAIDDVVPRIVFLPYLRRDGVLTCTLPTVRIEREKSGAKLVLMPKGHGGGFGCVAMNTLAIGQLHAHATRETAAADVGDGYGGDESVIFGHRPLDLRWSDNGETKLAMFYERLEGGLWYGEDTSFFRYRVPETVTVEALVTGYCKHAGIALDLSKI